MMNTEINDNDNNITNRDFQGPTPNTAHLASYIITLSNRNSAAKLDRLLKVGIDKAGRNNPLVMDCIVRSELLNFFSKNNIADTAKKLISYYREYDMFSALLDIKNMLVISRKFEIKKTEAIFDEVTMKIVLGLINSGKSHIIESYIKSSIAMCILANTLDPNIKELFTEENPDLYSDIPKELLELIKLSGRKTYDELKYRSEDRSPITVDNSDGFEIIVD